MKNPTIIAGLFLSLLLPNFKDMAKIMQIPLTQGCVALVDEADFEYLNQWKWGLDSKQKNRKTYTKYAKRGTRKGGVQKTIFMHRAILGLTDPKVFVDHIDRDGLNNQRSNLRIATAAQNSANSKSRHNATSKYLGVSWAGHANKWVVHINSKGVKKRHIGLFVNETDAALAYNNAAIELHGEFANLNKV